MLSIAGTHQCTAFSHSLDPLLPVGFVRPRPGDVRALIDCCAKSCAYAVSLAVTYSPLRRGHESARKIG